MKLLRAGADNSMIVDTAVGADMYPPQPVAPSEPAAVQAVKDTLRLGQKIAAPHWEQLKSWNAGEPLNGTQPVIREEPPLVQPSVPLNVTQPILPGYNPLEGPWVTPSYPFSTPGDRAGNVTLNNGFTPLEAPWEAPRGSTAFNPLQGPWVTPSYPFSVLEDRAGNVTVNEEGFTPLRAPRVRSGGLPSIPEEYAVPLPPKRPIHTYPFSELRNDSSLGMSPLSMSPDFDNAVSGKIRPSSSGRGRRKAMQYVKPIFEPSEPKPTGLKIPYVQLTHLDKGPRNGPEFGPPNFLGPQDYILQDASAPWPRVHQHTLEELTHVHTTPLPSGNLTKVWSNSSLQAQSPALAPLARVGAAMTQQFGSPVLNVSQIVAIEEKIVTELEQGQCYPNETIAYIAMQAQFPDPHKGEPGNLLDYVPHIPAVEAIKDAFQKSDINPFLVLSDLTTWAIGATGRTITDLLQNIAQTADTCPTPDNQVILEVPTVIQGMPQTVTDSAPPIFVDNPYLKQTVLAVDFVVEVLGGEEPDSETEGGMEFLSGKTFFRNPNPLFVQTAEQVAAGESTAAWRTTTRIEEDPTLYDSTVEMYHTGRAPSGSIWVARPRQPYKEMMGEAKGTKRPREEGAVPPAPGPSPPGTPAPGPSPTIVWKPQSPMDNVDPAVIQQLEDTVTKLTSGLILGLGVQRFANHAYDTALQSLVDQLGMNRATCKTILDQHIAAMETDYANRVEQARSRGDPNPEVSALNEIRQSTLSLTVYHWALNNAIDAGVKKTARNHAEKVTVLATPAVETGVRWGLQQVGRGLGKLGLKQVVPVVVKAGGTAVAVASSVLPVAVSLWSAYKIYKLGETVVNKVDTTLKELPLRPHDPMYAGQPLLEGQDRLDRALNYYRALFPNRGDGLLPLYLNEADKERNAYHEEIYASGILQNEYAQYIANVANGGYALLALGATTDDLIEFTQLLEAYTQLRAQQMGQGGPLLSQAFPDANTLDFQIQRGIERSLHRAFLDYLKEDPTNPTFVEYMEEVFGENFLSQIAAEETTRWTHLQEGLVKKAHEFWKSEVLARHTSKYFEDWLEETSPQLVPYMGAFDEKKVHQVKKLYFAYQSAQTPWFGSPYQGSFEDYTRNQGLRYDSYVKPFMEPAFAKALVELRETYMGKSGLSKEQFAAYIQKKHPLLVPFIED